VSSKVDKHFLIQSVKDLAAELGRTPSRVDFESKVKGGRYQLGKHFRTYAALLTAAELPTYQDRLESQTKEEKLLRQYRSICMRKEQIQGFFRHVLDLEELFRRAGNPKVLKLSAMPDTHVKYKDERAVKSYLKFIEWYNPDVHFILGDFADCEGLSHWPGESLEPRRIVPEMKQARDLLAQIVSSTPKCSTRIFLEGNHENWIDQALKRMPELFEGLEDLGIEINVKKLMALEKYEYELFPLNHLVQIGNAHFTHGIFTSIHHAKKHLDVFKTSVYYGHLHDNQTHNQTSVNGNLEAACCATLARLDAKFLKGKPNNWVHGHRAFDFFRDGSYRQYFISIENGISSFGGVVFDGNV
jgi:hypothetical protein